MEVAPAYFLTFTGCGTRLHGDALAIREKALGPDHPDTARGLNRLAFLLQAMGNLPVRAYSS